MTVKGDDLLKTCVECGKEFETSHKGNLSCSDACRKNHTRRQAHEHHYRKHNTVLERDCIICGTRFRRGYGEKRHGLAKTCSDACSNIRCGRTRDAVRTCIVCGKEFRPSHGKVKFCGAACRKAHIRKYNKEWRRKQRGSIGEPSIQNCIICGQQFKRGLEGRHGRAKTCSKACSLLNYQRLHAKQVTERAVRYRCACPSCGEKFKVIISRKKKAGISV